jgi:excisionase family DNA binding protein
MEKIFCNVREAASALGVGRSAIYELMNEGAFETVKIGKRRLFPIESITAYAESLRKAA